MDAIKLGGGALSRVMVAQAIVEAGIAVMGHVGLLVAFVLRVKLLKVQ